MTEAPPPPPASPPPPRVVPVADVADARAALGAAIAGLDEVLARGDTFTEDERQRRVDGEWSLVESLRHVVLVVDLWLSKTVLGVDDPFHPMALPPNFLPPKLPGTSIDPDARPSFGEAAAVVRDRMATLSTALASLTETDLVRAVPNHAGTVAGALGVLRDELLAHTRFMQRDLDALRPG